MSMRLSEMSSGAIWAIATASSDKRCACASGEWAKSESGSTEVLLACLLACLQKLLCFSLLCQVFLLKND